MKLTEIELKKIFAYLFRFQTSGCRSKRGRMRGRAAAQAMGVKIGHKPKLTPIAYLEARDPTNNVHRAYSLAYGQDLFGNWVVETTYGRIGGNEAEALQYVQKSFKRRQSAPKRIGVTYKVRTTLDSDQ